MSKVKISGVIITFNEEKNIRRCVESIKDVVDEIVVVDSFSTDKTEAICEEYEVKFYKHRFVGYGEQKNIAVGLATHDHVLSLDADEALSDELTKSILKVKESFDFHGYSSNRLTNFCGSWIRHCGWYPDRKVRLWDRTKGRWSKEPLHETVVMQPGATVGFLRGDILHFSFPSISDHLKQSDKFSTVAAQESFKKKKRVNTLTHIVIYPLVTFIRMYFLKAGFLDGYAGFLVCVTGAYYRFIKYAKLKSLYQHQIRV